MLSCFSCQKVPFQHGEILSQISLHLICGNALPLCHSRGFGLQLLPGHTEAAFSQHSFYHSSGNCVIYTATKTLIAGCNGSVIPDDGSAPVILDLAHATQGNGAADCAITYLHLIMNGENDFAEKYLHRYCELQGCTVAYVQSWCSIVAAAELSRGRVHEQDFLLTWVDVVDWV